VIWLMSFSVRAACLLGIAWTAALLWRRSPADVRHRLWATALLGVAVLALPITLPTAVRIVTPVQFAATALGDSAQAGWLGWLTYWRTIWMVGVVLFTLRLLIGLARVARWTRDARPSGGVLLSEHAATPLTWGFFRPVILFPPYTEAWTPEQRKLALLHEQAHVDRNDWLFQMIASAVQAVFWFHPLVWMACFQMRREAEAAADDRVLQSGANPPDYAAQLLAVARSMRGPTPLAAVPMTARQGLLESRVRAILERDRLRGQGPMLARVGMSVLVCVCVIPLLALQANSILPRSVAGSLAAPMPRTLLPDAGPQSAGSAARAQRDSAPQTDPPRRNGLSGPEAPQTDSPPRVLYKREPAYTEEARAARVQGTVVLTLTITEQGRAEDIRVARSLDPGLDRQAIEAIEDWQFAPATKNGTPVRIASTIEVNFRLL
jgi:TonB family protein